MQVAGCGKDISKDKVYYRRHQVCPEHLKAPEILIGNSRQRFCQQCSQFHPVEEFDDNKRCVLVLAVVVVGVMGVWVVAVAAKTVCYTFWLTVGEWSGGVCNMFTSVRG